MVPIFAPIIIPIASLKERVLALINMIVIIITAEEDSKKKKLVPSEDEKMPGGPTDGVYVNEIRNSGFMYMIEPLYIGPNQTFNVELDNMEVAGIPDGQWVAMPTLIHLVIKIFTPMK